MAITQLTSSYLGILPMSKLFVASKLLNIEGFFMKYVVQLHFDVMCHGKFCAITPHLTG